MWHLNKHFRPFPRVVLMVSIRLRTTCIFDSKLKATCSSWPKLGQVDSTWFVLPTCLAGVHGGLVISIRDYRNQSQRKQKRCNLFHNNLSLWFVKRQLQKLHRSYHLLLSLE